MFTSLSRSMFVWVLFALHTAEVASAVEHADFSKTKAKQQQQQTNSGPPTGSPNVCSNERGDGHPDCGGDEYREFADGTQAPQPSPASGERESTFSQQHQQLPPATPELCRIHGRYPAPYYTKRYDFSGCVARTKFVPPSKSKVDWETIGARRYDVDMELSVTLRILTPVIADLVSTACYLQGTVNISPIILLLALLVNLFVFFFGVHQLMAAGRVSDDLSSPNDVAEIFPFLVEAMTSCAISFTLFYSARNINKDDASVPVLWGAVMLVFIYAVIGRLTPALPFILIAYFIVTLAFAVAAMRTGRHATQEAFFVVVVVLFIRIMEFMQNATPGMLLSYLDDPTRRNAASGFGTVILALLCGCASNDFMFDYSYETRLLDVASPTIVRSLAYLSGGGTQISFFLLAVIIRFVGYALFKFATASHTYNLNYARGAGKEKSDLLFTCYVSKSLVVHLPFSDKGLMGTFASITFIVVQMKQNIVFFFFSFAVYYLLLVSYPDEMAACVSKRQDSKKSKTTTKNQTQTQNKNQNNQNKQNKQQSPATGAPAIVQQHGAMFVASHVAVDQLLSNATFTHHDLELVQALTLPITTKLSMGQCANLDQFSLVTCGRLFASGDVAVPFELPTTIQEYTVTIDGVDFVPSEVRVTPTFLYGNLTDCLVTLRFADAIAELHDDPIIGASSSESFTTLMHYNQSTTMGPAEFVEGFVLHAHPSVPLCSGNSVAAVTQRGVAIAAIQFGVAVDGRAVARAYDPTDFTNDPIAPLLTATHGGKTGRESAARDTPRAVPPPLVANSSSSASAYQIDTSRTDPWEIATEKKKQTFIQNIPSGHHAAAERMFARYEARMNEMSKRNDALRRRVAAKPAPSRPSPTNTQLTSAPSLSSDPPAVVPITRIFAALRPCNCRDPTPHTFCPRCEHCRKYHATDVPCDVHATRYKERVRLEREANAFAHTYLTYPPATITDPPIEVPLSVHSPSTRGRSNRRGGRGRGGATRRSAPSAVRAVAQELPIVVQPVTASSPTPPPDDHS